MPWPKLFPAPSVSNEGSAGPRASSLWPWVVGAGLAVAVIQAWLVARAGTDIPYLDQWVAEGKWLYPAWQDGTLRLADIFRPYNEHHIVWTQLLNLLLFELNGQWDPILQLLAGAALHAVGAAFLTYTLGAAWRSVRMRAGITAAVILACLPLAGWHNALWGFQTQAYFALLLAMPSFFWLGAANRSPGRLAAGLVMGGAAMLAMGPGELLPLPLLGLAVLRMAEKRKWNADGWRTLWPAGTLLAMAWVLAVSVPAPRSLQAGSPAQFAVALGSMLAWPHPEEPLAAVVLNLPLGLVLAGRILRRREPHAAEDFVLLLGGWAAVTAAAIAWARGGGAELQAGVPSRYVDFLILLPLANTWCALRLISDTAGRWRMRLRPLGVIWGLFLFVGWLGVSLQMWRGIVRPRMRDRLAPVRLAVAFQKTGDPAVFLGQPRLYILYPEPEVALTVLHDPRLQGRLPPSLQPQHPLGPLSRLARMTLGQDQ